MSGFAFPKVFPALRPCEVPGGRRRSAFVYIIQDGDDGHVKIGWAVDPFDRLKQLQTGNSRELRLLYLEDMFSKRAAAHVERTLHEEFLGHRVRGEWFRFIGSLYQLLIQCRYERSTIVEQIRRWDASNCSVPDDYFEDLDTFTDDEVEDVA